MQGIKLGAGPWDRRGALQSAREKAGLGSGRGVKGLGLGLEMGLRSRLG